MCTSKLKWDPSWISLFKVFFERSILWSAVEIAGSQGIHKTFQNLDNNGEKS